MDHILMTPDDHPICRDGSCCLCEGVKPPKEENSPEGVEILAEIAAQRGFYGE